MIKEPELAILLSMIRLKGNQDFDRITEWLSAQRERMSKDCELLADDIPLRRSQGAALALRSLLEYVEQAESMAEKLRRSR